MEKEQRDTLPLRKANLAIGKAMRLHHRICERRLAELPIHRSQHMLLMRISKEGSLPSQRELAAQMEISPAAVAVALKRLESDGYIERLPDASDSRVNAISITEAGRAIVTESRRIFDELDREAFADIDECETRALTAALEKLCNNLQKMVEEEKK